MRNIKILNFASALNIIWSHVRQSDKNSLILLVLIICLSSVVELLSIGMIFPFLAALSSPEEFMSSIIGSKISDFLSIGSEHELIIILTSSFILATLLAGLIRVLMLWYGTKISYSISSYLGAKIYTNVLFQPYLVHINRNSSEVIDVICNKTVSLMMAVNGAITIASSTFILIIITIGMFTIDPEIFLLGICSFGLIYVLVWRLTRNQLQKNAITISQNSTKVMRFLQEGLSGIRDVLMDGTQSVFLNHYKVADIELRRAQGINIFISQCPRYIVECLGMTLIAMLAFFMVQKEGGILTAIPILGFLALSVQRALPLLQQIFSSWAAFKGYETSLREAIFYLDQRPIGITTSDPLKFEKKIEFINVSFRYESVNVLSDITFSIKKGEKIGVIGTTGSGKSTLVDVFMYLLPPTNGEILVDGVALKAENHAQWQKNISHVPQEIYLIDGTIAENIAFGMCNDDIDLDRLRVASRKAQIFDTISGWPLGFDTKVGERGVRLSGGQRQRLGIARALYKNSNIIIFDEATSALDVETESSVMKSILELEGDLTILIIAHRVSTLSSCDKIFAIDNGVLKELSISQFLDS